MEVFVTHFQICDGSKGSRNHAGFIFHLHNILVIAMTYGF